MEELLIKAGPDGIVALALIVIFRKLAAMALVQRVTAAKVDALADHFGVRIEARVATRIVPSSLATGRLRRRSRVAVPVPVDENKEPTSPLGPPMPG